MPPELVDRPMFRPTHNKKGIPCPSVVLNRRNMRAQSAKGPRG